MLFLKIVDIHKKDIVLNFSLFKAGFFWFFLSSIYKMVDSMDIYTFLSSIYKMVDSMDIYKSLNINIGTVVKNQKIRLKKVCDKAVNTYPPTITFVPECRMT